MVESQVMIARGRKRPQDGEIGNTMDQRGTGSEIFLESMDQQQGGVINAHWLPRQYSEKKEKGNSTYSHNKCTARSSSILCVRYFSKSFIWINCFNSPGMSVIIERQAIKAVIIIVRQTEQVQTLYKGVSIPTIQVSCLSIKITFPNKRLYTIIINSPLLILL